MIVAFFVVMSAVVIVSMMVLVVMVELIRQITFNSYRYNTVIL